MTFDEWWEKCVPPGRPNRPKNIAREAWHAALAPRPEERNSDEAKAIIADAARYRHFRDEMDESEKLRMIAAGTDHYDATIDASLDMNKSGDSNG
jgi:hypothetical protein